MAMVAGELGIRRRVYLVAEYFVLFFGIVAVFITVARGVSPIPFLVVLGAAAVVYLMRQPTFDRRDFLRPEAVRGQLRSILTLWALAWVLAVAGLLVYDRSLLLDLPRHQPVLWAIIMVAYPLLSAYPQELIFRAFVFQRYGRAFGPAGTVAASAAAFGFAHIFFHNWFAVIASTVGGVLFATRYARSRSLLAVSVEHGLYGVLIFTVGLGQFVYHGPP
ncbi:CPBP family intramembrane glutamic endopeptidase [Actinocrispum wychmicini]|uniref:CAAX prenyl protease-like protein n=1 Tax=Actinocrispum wychmicini TaxID=1213861 RepID=A0A4V2S5W1_9PSEU|nr:CPBP family intramembrane glutamic endopeptidase [Actinocrispum wychmicini]TCO53710.1 CAAX prenyl protease-like protein [Actinocrispum wychmicini]